MPFHSIAPSISVVVPTFNRGKAVNRTIDSVLSQDLPPEEVEIIVVDDGSTDDTFAVLQELYGQNARVQLFQLSNGGVAKARNFGLAQARGEFIAFLDHDDFWLPQKLRLQREQMKNPLVGVVYCFWIEADGNGIPSPFEMQHSQHSWWRPQRGNVYPWILVPDRHQIPRNPIYSMTFPLIRTSLVRDLSGFDESMVPSDDWDLWIRLSKITQFNYVPQVLAHYVQHANQQHNVLEASWSSWSRLCVKHPVDFRKYPLAWFKTIDFAYFCRERMAYCRAKNALFAGNYKLIPLFFIRALFIRPDQAVKKHWIYLFLRAFHRNTTPY